MLIINSARLVAALIEAGFGEAELCVKAGVAHQTFAKMKRGTMVRFDAVGRICRALDLPAAEIIKEVTDETLQEKRPQKLVSEGQGQAHQPRH
jgi:DNA-binding Xre family transcriptional regulator